MKKIKKISLILLIWLLTLYLISVLQVSPIPILLNTATFHEIPTIYWLVILISPLLLYIIAKDSKNPLVPLMCVILYFFLFYSNSLYYLSPPRTSDIGTTVRSQEILLSITHVDSHEFNFERFISTANYFRWPVYFIFSKIFNSILGIGALQVMNLGLFSLLLIFPILLSLFYKRSNNVENDIVYFFIPALYLTLVWHFINSQFVPQFLALIYLFILFGFYPMYRKEKKPLFLLLMIIFYTLIVFTHVFIFIFFLVAIIFEVYWSEYIEMKKAKFISYGLIIIFFAILFPYISVFYSLGTTSTGGGSWNIFQYILSESNPVEAGYQLQPLFYLIPRMLDQIISLITKVLLVIVFSIVVIGLLFYIFKKRDKLDISILIGSASWFLLGFARLVLGQRALQVAMLPLARHIKYPHKLFSYLSKVAIVIILIAPSMFIANDIINSSIDGEYLVQDSEENIAGRFMDNHIINESIVLSPRNAYPTGYPSEFRIFESYFILQQKYEWEILDFILYSPKLKKRFQYLNLTFLKDFDHLVIYDNKDIEILYLKKEM